MTHSFLLCTQLSSLGGCQKLHALLSLWQAPGSDDMSAQRHSSFYQSVIQLLWNYQWLIYDLKLLQNNLGSHFSLFHKCQQVDCYEISAIFILGHYIFQNNTLYFVWGPWISQPKLKRWTKCTKCCSCIYILEQDSWGLYIGIGSKLIQWVLLKPVVMIWAYPFHVEYSSHLSEAGKLVSYCPGGNRRQVSD